MKLATILRCTLILFTLFSHLACGIFSPSKSHALRAEQLRNKGQLKAAISEYEKHAQSRINDPERPTSENPYFYYLLIGDIYLELEQIDQARNAYETCLANKSVSTWDKQASKPGISTKNSTNNPSIESNTNDIIVYQQAIEKEEALLSSLIAYRFRMLGQFYEDRLQFEQAIEIYREFRYLDPDIFDHDIDRAHREMIANEDLRSK